MGGAGPHTNPREKTREKTIRTKISGKTHITCRYYDSSDMIHTS